MEGKKIENIAPNSVEEEGQKASHGAEEKITADQEPKNIREETIREAESKFIPPKLDELFPASFLEEHGIRMEEEENKVTFILPTHDVWVDSDGYSHPPSEKVEIIFNLPLKWQIKRLGDKVLFEGKFIFEGEPLSIEYKNDSDNKNKFYGGVLKRLKAERAVEELGIGKEKEYPLADKVNYIIKIIEEKADSLERSGEFFIFYDPKDDKMFICYNGFGTKRFDFEGRLKRNWDLHFPSSYIPIVILGSSAPRETIKIYEEKYKYARRDAGGEKSNGKREILTDKREENIQKTKELFEEKQYKYYKYNNDYSGEDLSSYEIEIYETDRYYTGRRFKVDYSIEVCEEFGTFYGQKVIYKGRRHNILCTVFGVSIEENEKKLLLKEDRCDKIYSANINDLSKRIEDGRVQFIAEEQNIMEQSPDKYPELKESEKETPKAQE